MTGVAAAHFVGSNKPLGKSAVKSITAANGVVNAFAVTGGVVVITSVLGIVTTQIGATAATLKLQSDPTATGTTNDICSTATVTGDIVGTLYSVSGIPGVALEIGDIGFVEGPSKLFYVSIGTIENVFSADPVGGVIEWTINYIPIQPGAAIAPV